MADVSGAIRQMGFDTSRAACRGMDVEVFYPRITEASDRNRLKVLVREAVGVCEQCQVKDPCLDYALTNEPLGIWGGKTESQRMRMRRKHGIVIKGASSLLGENVRNSVGEQNE